MHSYKMTTRSRIRSTSKGNSDSYGKCNSNMAWNVYFVLSYPADLAGDGVVLQQPTQGAV